MGWGGGMGVFCCVCSNIRFCRRCVSCGVGEGQGINDRYVISMGIGCRDILCVDFVRGCGIVRLVALRTLSFSIDFALLMMHHSCL